MVLIYLDKYYCTIVAKYVIRVENKRNARILRTEEDPRGIYCTGSY